MTFLKNNASGGCPLLDLNANRNIGSSYQRAIQVANDSLIIDAFRCLPVQEVSKSEGKETE